MPEQQGKGRFAVVTGASSGIGLELARVFAQQGFDLLINAEDSRLDAAADEIRAAGANVQTVQADLSKYEGVEQLWAAIQQTGRPPYAIAINAGVGTGGEFARETDLQTELQMIDLNVKSTVQLAKYVLPELLSR